MTSLSIKQKILISGGIGVLAVAVLFFILIWPLSVKIAQKSDEISETRKQIMAVEKKNKFGKKIEADLEKSKETMPKIKSSLIDPEKILDLVVILEETAAQTGNQFSIGESSFQSKFVSFSVNLWGSFANLNKFIKKLENLPYLAQIDDLNIRKLEPQEVALKNQNAGPLISLGDVSAVVKFRVFAK